MYFKKYLKSIRKDWKFKQLSSKKSLNHVPTYTLTYEYYSIRWDLGNVEKNVKQK